jgi:serine/threonine protein kinase/Tfp pilus assembly protein PilF
MNPERFREIEEIWQRVVEFEGTERAAFLDRACADDPTLRRDVESLLAADRQAAAFLEKGALEEAVKFVEGGTLPSEQSWVGRSIRCYEILSLLGAGGMGHVYRARDTKLERDVAIKVLPSSFAGDHDRVVRFQWEARALAALNHPHIATIYGFEEVDNNCALVLELVEGPSLAARLAVGAIPVKEAFEIARQIASAIEAAHKKGMFHRDIKPSNIKISADGTVKVLDFGLAKAFASGDGDADHLSKVVTGTHHGVILGTPAYMSPEQATGQDVDKCTDMWAFGCVLYEMLTRRRAFTGASVADVISAVLAREPNWQELPAETPPAIERLLRRCLEKDPKNRLQDIADARKMLDETLSLWTPASAVTKTQRISRRFNPANARWAAVFLLTLLLTTASAAYLLKSPSGTGGISPFGNSFAVLPFENLSGDPQQELFSDAMTDALITSLAQISDLRIISRASVIQYKRSRKPVREIANELHVSAVLVGTTLSSGDRVRIGAQLVDPQTGRNVWARNYEGDMSDILRLQSEVAQAVAQEIRVKMTGAEKARLARFRPVRRDVYEAYLRGVARGNKEDFRKAIALDPDYAPAYAGLARLYDLDAFNRQADPRVAYPMVWELAQIALQKDDTLSEAHALLASVFLNYYWNWREAENQFRLALESIPGNATVRDYYAHYLMVMNRFQESVQESKRAMEADPLDPGLMVCVAWHSYYAGQYDQTIDFALKALAMDPNNGFATRMMGLAFEQKSMLKEAVASLQKSKDAAELGHVYATLGDKGPARALLTDLLEKQKTGYVSAYSIAVLYHWLGENDRAFEWLEKAYNERSAGLVYIKGDPRIRDLRSDPRFENLVRRIGLPL